MVLLVGNFKMAPEKSTDAVTLAKKIFETARTYKKSVKTVICAPAIHIPFLTKAIKSIVSIGGQGVAATSEIAQTGLISAGMLRSYGAPYCIVGHSESRARGESDEYVLGATLALLQKKITPIICVGEKERDAHGWYLSTIKSQVEQVILSVPKPDIKRLVFAYEPLWAIGKDAAREATPSECNEMVIFIRKTITDVVGEKIANTVPVLYGGSVNEQNAASFITLGAAQGLLVGRTSLDAKRFAALTKSIALVA
jgi:triosephosphate isomerase (TIM)